MTTAKLIEELEYVRKLSKCPEAKNSTNVDASFVLAAHIHQTSRSQTEI